MKWAEEERAKTVAWVEEQREAIGKEKRRLLASRARGGAESAQPSRKERAEIQVNPPLVRFVCRVCVSSRGVPLSVTQALQATIEKMKVDYESLRKKSKMNDSRLNQLVKDQNDIIAGEDIIAVHYKSL